MVGAKATARAHSNIALTKYWGKRDSRLNLPTHGSLSLTLDGFHTTTTVEFDSRYKTDELYLNHRRVKEGRELERVTAHLDLVRQRASIMERAKVVSVNNFPTAAGLASSASGFAALSLAGAAAAGLELGERELSMLARRGSGSAARSIPGGFVEWRRGTRADGSDSYGCQIAPPDHWPEFRMVVCVVQTSEKKVKSGPGMEQTKVTCPYYPAWKVSAQQNTRRMRRLIAARDFPAVGELAQFSAMKMHATMLTTRPPLVYWQPATLEVIHAVLAWQAEGLEAYFTIDAGPQVKVMCLAPKEREVVGRLQELESIQELHVCRNGPAARLLNKHLF